jgi:hypothetical protein
MRTTHHRLQRIKPALVAAWIAITVLSPRLTIAQSGSRCTVFGSPQVNPALVELESVAKGSVYKKGMSIHITLTIRAGHEGVYLPDFFGAFQETCSHGFAAEVLTLQGRAANLNEPGCMYAGGPPKITYVKLKPEEVRTWEIALPTKAISPGQYCLYAEYLSPEDLMGWSVNLPDNKALVAKGRITATPIAIEIR